MKRIAIPKEEILKRFSEGKAYLDIQKEFGFSLTGIKKYCKRLGITRRSIYPNEFTPNEFSLIIGTIFGDGHIKISSKKNEINARLSLKHGPKQLAYLEYKRAMLSRWLIPNSVIGENKNKTLYFTTVAHPLFTELRNKFYPEGIKLITPEILDLVDEKALAIWVADDGCLARKDKYVLSTQSFTEGENHLIAEWFYRKFGIGCRVNKVSYINENSNQKFVLHFYGRHADKLSKLISPYLPECMHYKLITQITNHYDSRAQVIYG